LGSPWIVQLSVGPVEGFVSQNYPATILPLDYANLKGFNTRTHLSLKQETLLNQISIHLWSSRTKTRYIPLDFRNNKCPRLVKCYGKTSVQSLNNQRKCLCSYQKDWYFQQGSVEQSLQQQRRNQPKRWRYAYPVFRG
jgi:hypothetical protein